MSIESVAYSDENHTATLSVNQGINLPIGSYSLLVCGSTSSSVSNQFGDALDGDRDGVPGDDYVLDFEISLDDLVCFPIINNGNAVAVVCL